METKEINEQNNQCESLDYKYFVELFTKNGIKSFILKSKVDNINENNIKKYFKEKYGHITIMSIEKIINTKLISGVYINEN